MKKVGIKFSSDMTYVCLDDGSLLLLICFDTGSTDNQQSVPCDLYIIPKDS
jgi:hypothetical protein